MSLIRWMNRASRFLWITGILLMGIFGILFVRPFDIPLPKGGQTDAQVTDAQQVFDRQTKDVDRDFIFVEKRDFFDFQLGPSMAQASGSLEEQPVLEGSTDFSRRYKLVGIIVDDKEQAVFESLSDGSVVFLDTGGSLDNYVLKSVSRGEVVLDDQGTLIKVNLSNER